jgi:Putative addiction module component
MSIDEIEAEALKLDPHARARLARKLLESLEGLSAEENERLWAEEAERRDADWDARPGSARPAADVLRDARAKLRWMRPPEFHRLAEQELNESAQFYDLEDPGLGSAFLQEIARCLQSIEAHPMAGALVRGDVRRRLIHRFPFALLYRITPDRIRILAVMNLKRRPAYWVGRE